MLILLYSSAKMEFQGWGWILIQKISDVNIAMQLHQPPTTSPHPNN